ncbi:MAG TPA: gluconate 2-dehydrogenase subunit 3 family protein [Terriglobia bacterium]|nr:gluconate 2-dehydrogenase subunit 3 family protein [Terriglobia bacterium]
MDDQKDIKRDTSMNRRDLLKVVTVIPASALLPLGAVAKQPAGMMHPQAAPAAAQAATTPAAYQPKVLSGHEWRTVSVLSDYLVPADARSGSATEAGVPAFIDDWLDFKRGRMLDGIRGGLTWLDIESNRAFGHDFVDCTEMQQKETLDRIAYPKTAAPEDAAGVAFFNQLRDLVVTGFFSSEMGVKDLPYLGNQMMMEWNGCPANVLAKLGLNKA